MEEKIIQEVRKFIPGFMKITGQVWFDYDKEADVLYISFEKLQNGDDSIMEGNIIVHERGDKIVGLTVVNDSELG